MSAQRILLVEDDENVAFGLTAILQLEGMTVDLATTGREAIEHLVAAKPDVVLLDVGLPDMDGASVFAEIASRHPKLPVIFSTGHADRSRLEPLLRRANVGCLMKPYDLEDLLDLIRDVSQPSR